MDDSQNRIQELIRDLSDKNEDIRWGAAALLARTGTAAVEPLMAALDDRDSVVRLRAAWALGRIGDRRAVKKLIRTLRDGDWSVRMRGADALGALRAEEATADLLLLLRDGNADVRRHAVKALTQIADPASADRISDALKDTDWRVRMGAALALAAIGDEKSISHLRAALSDENEYVRKIAQTVLKSDGGMTSTMTIKAGDVKDLPPGSMKAVQAGDREVLLVNLDGRIFAINNRCTHHGCGLSEGKLEGETVRCPCHGSVFSVKSGAVVKGPAKIPEPAYTVTVENGTILLTV